MSYKPLSDEDLVPMTTLFTKMAIQCRRANALATAVQASYEASVNGFTGGRDAQDKSNDAYSEMIAALRAYLGESDD